MFLASISVVVFLARQAALCGASTPYFHLVIARRAATSNIISYLRQLGASYLMAKVLSGPIYHKLL